MCRFPFISRAALISNTPSTNQCFSLLSKERATYIFNYHFKLNVVFYILFHGLRFSLTVQKFNAHFKIFINGRDN